MKLRKQGFNPLETTVLKELKLSNKGFQTGFTFIELMIVAAIIGILAAIAIPNFMQAQIRAKVSRARGEQEMLLIALQSYYVDKGMYPLNAKQGQPSDISLITLTTPTMYLTRLPQDPFRVNYYPELKQYTHTSQNVMGLSSIDGYGYVNYLQMSPKKPVMYSPQGGMAWFVVMSPGPDLALDYNNSTIPPAILIYDPSNGTTSKGDLYFFGP